jgi:hypothetical protein
MRHHRVPADQFKKTIPPLSGFYASVPIDKCVLKLTRRPWEIRRIRRSGNASDPRAKTISNGT